MTLVPRRRVLVTGATGSLGAAIAQRMFGQGYCPTLACREERTGVGRALAAKLDGTWSC
jgi:NAD(P)-dependent dehydrogenase (short-subunit alcohol dehydrogenase family)